MGVDRKTIISEVEDSMRAQDRTDYAGPWSEARKAYLNLAAYLILFVEKGDRYNAPAQAQAQD